MTQLSKLVKKHTTSAKKSSPTVKYGSWRAIGAGLVARVFPVPGMGHCQGEAENYNCECRVADIIARETGVPAEAVGRRPWPATSSLQQRWLSDQQKADIAAIAKKAEE